MNVYRMTLDIDDEVQAETHEEAWVKFYERIKRGYYGPTLENVQLIEEVRVEEAAAPEE